MPSKLIFLYIDRIYFSLSGTIRISMVRSKHVIKTQRKGLIEKKFMSKELIIIAEVSVLD